LRPTKNNAICCLARVNTIPEVKIPCAPTSRAPVLDRRLTRTFSHQNQNLHRGVVVVQHLPLRCFVDQFPVDGFDLRPSPPRFPTASRLVVGSLW
jgi:hypothetical protein